METICNLLHFVAMGDKVCATYIDHFLCFGNNFMLT